MKTKMKNSLFLAIVMLSITTNTILAQTEKNLNELSIKELKKESKSNPEALVLLGDIERKAGREIWINDWAMSEAMGNHQMRSGGWLKEENKIANKVSSYYSKARKYYKKAAEQNNAKGMYWIAKMNWGLPGSSGSFFESCRLNVTYAISLYELAASQNLAEAQYELGVYNARGLENVNSEANRKAFEYFVKAAEQNLPEAQYKLAKIYEERGGFENIKLRNKLMLSSANQGYGPAQSEMAFICSYSNNYNLAYSWAKLSDNNRMDTSHGVTKLIKDREYEYNRNVVAAKKGSVGIAQLEKTRKEEEEEEAKRIKQEEQANWNRERNDREEKRKQEDKEDEKRWANKPSPFQQMLNEQNASTAKIHNDQNEMQKQIKVNQADATGTRNYESVMRDAEAKRKYEEIAGESFPTLTKTENASTNNASSENTTSKNTDSNKSSSSTNNSEPLIAKKYPDHIENSRQAGKGNTETEACEDATKRVKEKHGTKVISIGNCYNIQKVYNHKGEQKGWFCYVDYSFNAQSLSDPNVKRKTTTSKGISK